MEVIEATTDVQPEQPKPQRMVSVRILRDVPWKRSYRIGDALDLPLKEANGLLKHGHAESLTTAERRKYGLLVEDHSGHRRLREHHESIRHYEKTNRMIPIKIVRNNGKPGAFEIGTISEMPFHEGMKLVEDGWAEHLTKAERHEHGFL